MCLILFGYKISKKYPFILAANRDEFFHRPTSPMHFWQNNTSLLAGKDLEQGGTWFGINKKGTFAALTNYRDPFNVKKNAPSRGEIIVDFLNARESYETHFNGFKKKAGLYNGFNLIFGDKDHIFWFSNLKNKIERIQPGIHGLSNRFLNTPWPKVVSGKKALHNIIHTPITLQALLTMLTDQSVPDDTVLPHTGVGIKWERILSPLFIQSDNYGTRSSIAMRMDQNGKTEVTERTYDPKNCLIFSDRSFSIRS